MKDSLLLVLMAACAFVVAWSFWYFDTAAGFPLFALFIITTLFADNIRLRRKLRQLEQSL